jgi:hypothetical protein
MARLPAKRRVGRTLASTAWWTGAHWSPWTLIGYAAASVVAFLLVRTAILNLFYSVGDLHDPGWLATVAWRNGWLLIGPPSLGGSYFSEHISPIFWLTNLVSYLLPLPKIDFFAAFMAAIYALYAAGIFRAWLWGDDRVSAARSVVALAVALLATFSAVSMQTLRLAHHEIAMPALALWFFIALVERNYRLAVVWFVLCLMVREDAGFHLFGLLVLWGLCLKIGGQRDDRAQMLWRFAAVAFAYAVIALAIKHTAFPRANNFSRVYSGIPPWQHLTGPFLSERFWFYLTERTFITVPLLVTLAWAAVSRNPLLPVGYIAFLPWLALHFVAAFGTTGMLGYYYAFPFWLSLAWPLVALHLWPAASEKQKARWPYVLVLLSSLVGWKFDRVVVYPFDNNHFIEHPFVYTNDVQNRAAADRFVDYFIANKTAFGSFAADMAITGLMMDDVTRANWLWGLKVSQPPDVIVYFVDSYEWPRIVPLLQTGAYSWFYRVPETRIRLAARSPLPSRLPLPLPFESAAAPSLK